MNYDILLRDVEIVRVADGQFSFFLTRDGYILLSIECFYCYHQTVRVSFKK